MAWYNPVNLVRRAREYFSRGETPEIAGLYADLRAYLMGHRKLMRDVYVMTHEPAQREARDLRSLAAKIQRMMGLYERAQRGRTENLVLRAARLNRYPTSIS